MTTKTLFDKAAEVIQQLQKAELKEDEVGCSLSIDLSPFVKNEEEAEALCVVMELTLMHLPYVASFKNASIHYVTSEDGEDDVSRIEYRLQFEPSTDIEEIVQRFKNDCSLACPRKSRPMTRNFRPETFKQALDFARWKESTHWAQAETDEGFYYGIYGGDDTRLQPYPMMFDNSYRGGSSIGSMNRTLSSAHKKPQPQSPKNCGHESRRGAGGAGDEFMCNTDTNVPQIWSAAHAAFGISCANTLFVQRKDAKAILVDFIGLDGKILGLEQKNRVR